MNRCLLTAAVMAISWTPGFAQSPPVPSRWTGEWISESSGHSGPLKARIRPVDECTYRATFRGRFAGIVPFWYNATFHVESQGDGVTVMAASQRLPLIGEYRTTATVTPSAFEARFTSRRDSGRFVMTPR